MNQMIPLELSEHYLEVYTTQDIERIEFCIETQAIREILPANPGTKTRKIAKQG